MKSRELMCTTGRQRVPKIFLSGTVRFVICIFNVVIITNSVFPDNIKKVSGELDIECITDGSSGTCCDCIMKDLKSIHGVVIVSSESMSDHLFSIVVDTERSGKFGIKAGMIVESLSSMRYVKIIKNESDAVFIEMTKESSIDEIISCKIKSANGQVVPLSAIASVRKINAEMRRLYTAGDRRMILTIEMPSNAYPPFLKYLNKKYLGNPGVSWRLLTDSAK